MGNIAILPKGFAVNSSNDTLTYITETMEYFNGINIDIEYIIDKAVRTERRNKHTCKTADEYIICFGDKIGGEISDLLENKPDIENLEELADFTLRASIAASLYLAEGRKYKSFSEYLIDNYLEKA